MLVVELDAYLVLSRLRAHVGDAASAVLVVVKIDLGFGGSFDGNGQRSGARLPRVNVKVGREVDFTADQTGSSGAHFVRASARDRAHRKLEGRAGYVQVLVLDADRMSAHLFGNEAYAVGGVVHVDDLAVVDGARRVVHVGGHVERTAAGYFERELALASHVSGLGGVTLARYPLGEAAVAGAAHVHGERRSGNVLVRKLDVDQVLTGLGGLIGDAAASIFVVVTFDVGLAWAFDR